MKRIIMLILLALIIPLSGCGKSSSPKAEASQLSWEKQTKNLKIVHTIESSGDYNGSVNTLEGMEKIQSDSSFIKAKVLDLNPVKYYKNPKKSMEMFGPNTKITVHVDKVIGGDKKLENKTINLNVPGGITTYNKTFEGQNNPSKKDYPVLEQDDNEPFPTRNSEIILSIQPTDWTYDVQSLTLDKNGFKKGTTFAPVMSAIHFWIKHPGDDKFVLNNSLIKNKQAVEAAPQNNELTEQINQKYNK
ncbi:hypothetical protein [Companilactobacillus mishanensis]|uniref:hypothetical protein n=1 Tax=Companilactobacillus mishanensis TaxID=2486008 RepID=UPI001296C201|nr:hypothetical protein [Companilactobacillus mishanensis]MQS90165.1 hypothetical protein [Companilactobacillus mishanensis]